MVWLISFRRSESHSTKAMTVWKTDFLNLCSALLIVWVKKKIFVRKWHKIKLYFLKRFFFKNEQQIQTRHPNEWEVIQRLKFLEQILECLQFILINWLLAL
jgi:hypothetical protein